MAKFVTPLLTGGKCQFNKKFILNWYMTSRIKINFNLNTSAIIWVLVPPTLTLAFKIPLTRFIRTKKWWWHSQGLVSSLNCYTRDLQGTWYCTSSLKLQWLSSLEDFWTVSITVYPSGISFKVSSSKLQKRVQKATHSPLQYKSILLPLLKSTPLDLVTDCIFP